MRWEGRRGGHEISKKGGEWNETRWNVRDRWMDACGGIKGRVAVESWGVLAIRGSGVLFDIGITQKTPRHHHNPQRALASILPLSRPGTLGVSSPSRIPCSCAD